MTKLCIFDLDGTLLDTIPTIAHYGNSALNMYGLSSISEERYKALVGDGRDELIHRMLSEFSSDTPELFAKVGGEYDRLYEADYLFKTKPYDGIRDLLSGLKEKGITLAVLSNKPHNVAKVVVEDFFPDMFSEIWGKKPDYPTKPAPDAVLKILEILAASLSEAIFIGDTAVDVKTGKNAGLFTIGCEWGFRTKAELVGAGADITAVSPMDILEIINTKN